MQKFEERKMKSQFSIILCIFLVSILGAATPTEELNPKLLEIYEQMLDKAGQSGLEGKEFEIDLKIKHATDKFLVFYDAYIQIDEETSYQMGKWIFTPEQTKDLEVERGSICRVRFKIAEVRTKSPYSDMPHILAEILSIRPLTT